MSLAQPTPALLLVLLLTLTDALSPPPAAAQEAVVTLHATVTGNQEQPRVMYILPWQQREATATDYVPDQGLAAELFTPIERDEFVRELTYRALLANTDSSTDTE